MNKCYINIFFKFSANILFKRFVSNFKVIMSPCEDIVYKQAIVALNGLQSNQQYLNNANKNGYKLNNFEKYLNRAGIKVDDLSKLSIIHVSGTKGKGTTCAFCESILQQHGYKTGFFSSPHLLEVRERIRINGIPLERETFGNYFWNVYRKCDSLKENSTDMPGYFAFLTIVAFHVFLLEKVDVAVVEVGIGGELDCTNIIKNTDVVGITSLGIDHTALLGDTIEEIAWQKAGIMKKGCKVFTVPQPETALNVLRERSKEKECSFEVVKPFVNGLINAKGLFMPADIFKLNISLSVALAEGWLQAKGYESLKSQLIKRAVENTCWPGRFQVIIEKNARFFLDGAHTEESITICSNWFYEKTCSAPEPRVLVFNITGNRDTKNFLKILKKCNFNKVYFVPNKAYLQVSADQSYTPSRNCTQIMSCKEHLRIWESLADKHNFKAESAQTCNSVNDAFQRIWNDSNQNYNVLVTGSIHLIGSAIAVIKKCFSG